MDIVRTVNPTSELIVDQVQTAYEINYAKLKLRVLDITINKCPVLNFKRPSFVGLTLLCEIGNSVFPLKIPL